MTLWLTLAGMAVVTFALRAAFLVLPPTVETPRFLRRALRYVPAAVLTAIWAPEVAAADERLPAGIAVVAAQDLPLRLNILVAAAIGITAGFFVERKK